jgi:hypothetical protein
MATNGTDATTAGTKLRCEGCGPTEATVLGGGFCATCRNVPVHAGFTRAQLKTAFDNVAEVGDWKAPIDAAVDVRYRNVTDAAIRFYTASTPQWTNDPLPELPAGNLRVRAKGYRAGPAGDH